MNAFKHLAKPRQTNVCLGHKRGEFAEHPQDCKLFYLCGNQGEAALASCPPRMLFNPVTKLCDKAENVNCNLPSTSTEALTVPDTSSKADQYCHKLYAVQRNSYALVFLPHPTNCHLYFMCYHGQALLQSCSSDLYWNSKLGKCVVGSQSECNKESNADDIETVAAAADVYQVDSSAVESGIKCPLYKEHIFPNTERCDSFIYCVNGQAVLQSCPFYQHFDVDSGRCMWRIKARCVKDLNLKYRSHTV